MRLVVRQATSTSRNELPDSRDASTEPIAAVSPSPALRIRVATNRGDLTRALAGGVDPTSSPEHALRAAQLTSDGSRRQLARSLAEAIARAREPRFGGAGIIDRRAVLVAEDAIKALVCRLIDQEPVAVQGMARVERLLTAGDSSPMYIYSSRGALRREVKTATDMLEPRSIEVLVAA